MAISILSRIVIFLRLLSELEVGHPTHELLWDYTRGAGIMLSNLFGEQSIHHSPAPKLDISWISYISNSSEGMQHTE